LHGITEQNIQIHNIITDGQRQYTRKINCRLH